MAPSLSGYDDRLTLLPWYHAFLGTDKSCVHTEQALYELLNPKFPLLITGNTQSPAPRHWEGTNSYLCLCYCPDVSALIQAVTVHTDKGSRANRTVLNTDDITVLVASTEIRPLVLSGGCHAVHSTKPLGHLEAQCTKHPRHHSLASQASNLGLQQ